jgi:transposase
MDIAPRSRSVAELKSEIVRLRCELAMERMEKEVLKKPPCTACHERRPELAVLY